VLNPTAMVTVTSSVVVLYAIVLIPTPLVFSIGSILGSVLLIPKVFFRIETWLSPRLYLRSTSDSFAFVLPSNTISLGAFTYPLPTDEIATDSNPVWDSI